MSEYRFDQSEDNKHRVFFKHLRLVSPQVANKLGVNAESPVFVSPAIRERQECAHCNNSFSPLVYQAGYEIRAQHYHPDLKYPEQGGIFYRSEYRNTPFIYCSILDTMDLFKGGGWFAFLQPSNLATAGRGNSDSVFVTHIKAYCLEDIKAVRKKFFVANHVGEGLVAESDHDDLVPVCGLEEHPEYEDRIKYRFRANQSGEVVFSAY